MTSANFEIVPVSSIHVERETRQRRELKNIEELADSIRDVGLINPIVITRERVLVAGERRLTAHQHLGFDSIAVQYAEDLDPVQLHLIELEENVRREDLGWQDHVNAVSEYHRLQAEHHQDWSQERTAKALNMSAANVTKHLLVKKMLDDGVKEVAEAPKLSTAANFAQRLQERRKTSAMRELRQQSPAAPAESDPLSLTPEDVAEATQPGRYAEIINVSFLEWMKEPLDDPYNLIHCDFPYGVNAGDTRGQSGALAFGQYEDKPEIYFDLIDGFLKHQDNFCAQSAHLIFWFSMDYYAETARLFTEGGWRVNPFPLIWFKSDNTGIIPDANRGPRRVYETALFASRGDRKVVRAVGNCVGAGVSKEHHVSEKPVPMLQHFLRMVVDETTYMLDPTCGSGNAVKVAEKLGASWSTGLEINPDFAEAARQNLDL